MTRDEIEEAARQLDQAERTGTQIGLLSLAHPDMTMDDAYAVQAALIQLKIASGRRPVGWKIGLTSKAMQAALGIDIPDSGVLLDDMVFENGGLVPKNRFIQPRIEAEIAFVMKRDLAGPDATIDAVLEATGHVRPALEILDTRVLRQDPGTGQARIITDTIADNAANAGMVTGGQPVSPGSIDLRWIGVILSRNGEVEETGLGAGVLDHPARGVAWLANRLAQYGGGIEAGQVVLSGSFIRPVEAPSGTSIEADFGPFGAVHCRFD